ncbi:unnamed protein product [Ostreobium quekettii]|uniref:Cytochrome P450 n=1 Tax=Ostreobium quekettii TaxID=121088 RepID=A0A8S1J886_9CHLO|nr:unnamed protein product [Ostreobium quekettii]
MDVRPLKQLAAVAFLAVVVFRVLHKWWFRIKYDWHLIPGPQAYPLFGNLPQFLRWEKPQIHLKITDWAKEYGKIFKVDAPGIGRLVFVTDPEYVQKNITGHGAHGLPKTQVYAELKKVGICLEPSISGKPCQANQTQGPREHSVTKDHVSFFT